MHPNALPWLLAATLLLAGCSGADQTRAGSLATTAPSQATLAPEGGSATGPATPRRVRIPLAPARLSLVEQVGAVDGEVGGLRVSGEPVPGRWMLGSSSGDVWVATKVGPHDRKSMWWGKGTEPHRMPPSPGSVLSGGVVISPDSHWIAWTRPAGDVDDPNPSRVMEVVDTTSGTVRWSRPARGDAREPGALAVTDDGVVVFTHCTQPGLDPGGWPRCDAARVDAWAPEADVTVTVPAGVETERVGPAGTLTSLRPLVQATGAHNGLLVRRTPNGPQRYVRLSARGTVDVVATLPTGTVAVSADEHHAVIPRGCRQSARRCRWIVVPLDGGERRPLQGIHGMKPYEGARAMLHEGFASFVAERDDLVVVQSRLEVGLVLARCDLAQARCVRVSGRGERPGGTAPIAPVVNGRIQGVEDYLARVHPACDDCYLDAGAFDQDTGNLLVTTRRNGSARLIGLSVVGTDGLLAELSCPGDFVCRGIRHGAETLGPGAHELTVWSSRHQVRVFGFDGTARRTIDLSAVLDGPSKVTGLAKITGLAWSPAGDRLAVTTSKSCGWQCVRSGVVSRIWLVDRDGDNPQRVHTAAYTGQLSGTPLGYIWSLQWSPDGRSLGFIEEQARLANHSEQSLSIRAVSLLLPGPGQAEPSTPKTLYDYPTRPFDEAAILWSPDSTRAAVRLPVQVLELSAEVGVVLASHPIACTPESGHCSPLIWPAEESAKSTSTPERWPGPVRPAAGQAILSTAQVKGWSDPRDVAVDAIDIRAVEDVRAPLFRFAGDWRIETAEPTPRWTELVRTGRVFQYGLVVDGDGDGGADCEIGIDNVALYPGTSHGWITNLGTGVSEEWPSNGFPFGFGTSGEMAYPTSKATTITFLQKRPAPCDPFGATAAFYAWTSAAIDGRVVAWDYAPDAAWLPLSCDQECQDPPHRGAKRRGP